MYVRIRHKHFIDLKKSDHIWDEIRSLTLCGRIGKWNMHAWSMHAWSKFLIDLLYSSDASICGRCKRIAKSKENNKMNIELGSLAKPLNEQLKSFKIKEAVLKCWEEDSKSITRIRLRGYASDSQCETMRKRLIKVIEKYITGVTTK